MAAKICRISFGTARIDRVKLGSNICRISFCTARIDRAKLSSKVTYTDSKTDRYTLRPLGGTENILAVLHESKDNTIAFTTWIQSKQYLTKATWEQALSRLQGNIEPLRLAIGWENGKRHFKLMEDPRVDFQVREISSSGDWKEAHEEMMRVIFATEKGPLWKVKVLQLPKVGNVTEEDRACNFQETNWFNSVIVIGIHHSIVDGASVLIMVNKLMSIMNEAVVTKHDEKEDTVPLQAPLESLLPQSKMKITWRDGFQIANDVYRAWFPIKRPSLKLYPAPLDVKESYTKTVAMQFSVSETEEIIAKNRAYGTTIHGVLVAAASVAMAHLLNEGSTPTPLDVSSNHAVNMRRFFSSDVDDALGLFIHWTDVSLNVSTAVTYSAFWELAKRATRDMHAMLQDDSVVQGCKLINYYLSDDSSIKRFSSSISPKEFATSNIGDCDKWFSSHEDGVRATRMVFSTAIQNSRFLSLHLLYKFRGRFGYNLDYGTNKMTEVNARKYAEMTVTLMKMAGGEEGDWIQIR